MVRCLICRRELPPRSENRFFPFCSESCQLQDLGRWFSDRYVIPGELTDGEPGRPYRPPPEDEDSA